MATYRAVTYMINGAGDREIFFVARNQPTHAAAVPDKELADDIEAGFRPIQGLTFETVIERYAL